MSDELKSKLTRVEDRIAALREKRSDLVKSREEAKEHYGTVEDGSDEETAAFDRAKEAVRAVGEVDDEMAALSDQQVEILRMLGDKEAVSRGESPQRPGEAEVRWNSGELFANEELQQALQFASATKARFGSLTIGEVANRDVLAADITGTADMRRGTYRGIVPQIQRPLRVLDLIPTGTTDGNLVPYTQEGGDFTGPAETAEGTAKPEANVTYTDADAPVRTIAAWMKLRKQALSDFAALRSIVDGRLRYAVQRRLEGQVLAGNGTGENLTGILNTSGIGTVGFDATVPLTELILSGITNVYLADGEADGVVLNPRDWQTALTQKAQNGDGSVGSYEYVGGGPFAVTPQVIWGVPCIPSPALAGGQGLVGDFQLGVQLLIREGVNVLISDSDQDDFIRNRVTMLGEMRGALPVWRPAVFQEVALA